MIEGATLALSIFRGGPAVFVRAGAFGYLAAMALMTVPPDVYDDGASHSGQYVGACGWRWRRDRRRALAVGDLLQQPHDTYWLSYLLGLCARCFGSGLTSAKFEVSTSQRITSGTHPNQSFVARNYWGAI